MTFISQSTSLLILSQQQYLLEKENVPSASGAYNSERSFGYQFSEGGKVGSVPPVQLCLDFLYSDSVFVFAFHVVDVGGDTCHRGEGQIDCGFVVGFALLR